MLYLLNDVAFDGGDITILAIATDLTSLLVVVVWVRSGGLGNLDLGDLHKVSAFVGGMGAKQESVGAVVVAADFLNVWEPLHRKSWPGQSSAERG